MTKVIILRGYPGSGKTTIGKELQKANIGTFIDHNSILTFVADIAGDDDGIYDDIANLELAIARKLLRVGKSVIVARGFSSLNSLRMYEDLATSLDVTVRIFRLDVDLTELSIRVESNERKNDFNPTTNQGALKVWIKSNPIEDYDNEVRIDNRQPIVAVLDIIKNVIKF